MASVWRFPRGFRVLDSSNYWETIRASNKFIMFYLKTSKLKWSRFRPLQAAAYGGLHSAIGVPSKLYFPLREDKPLNGIRLSVKDLFHLEGMKTTLGSRAYTECYGPQVETSVFVKNLIDNGAIIVGKTKMSAFAGSEIPPEKCIDYFPPWNPRADGYQCPSGSSSGAGATVAGYSWLDGSIASDSKCFCPDLKQMSHGYSYW